jgi:hypothetical protein
MSRGWLGALVGFVGLITVVSGIVQAVNPAFILAIVGAEATDTSRHFFGIVGMFMALFGGLTLHALFVQSAPALLWSGLQKFGAVAAVGLGIAHRVFSMVALPVACFDLISGILIVIYWRNVASTRG